MEAKLAPVAYPGTPRSPNSHESNVTYFNGIKLLSDEGRRWIEGQVGEEVSRERLSALELPWTNPRRLYEDVTMPSNCAPDQPRRSILEMYVMRYTSSFQSLVFPVISKSLFTKTLDLAYGPFHVFGYASAKSCAYSFLSLITLFGFDDDDAQRAVDCGSYASAAQRLVPHIIQEMTVDGLQSLIMLAQFQYFLGDLQPAGVSVSIATRLIYMLGAHRHPTDKSSAAYLPPYDKGDLNCHLRDLFWLCYSFDKDICLRMGQPPSIDDTQCDLSLPADYVRLQNTNIRRDTMKPDSSTQPLFPWDIRLSKMKSEAYHTLYSASARLKSDSEILSSIRHLDAALEQWRLSLHPDIRPILCFWQDMPPKATVNTQEVMLRLAYYHCVIIIHEASDRCKLSKADSGIGVEGISSSINLSITASRSSLSLLQATLPILKGECFCYHDAKILSDVPTLMRKIPIRYLTPAEIIHLKFLDGFTTELARLGMCAIYKAQEKVHASRDVRMFS
ncbi:hypothetical protein N7532_009390 [Penicillium argentinense]|uniref:Xylanolytic transcriptional activator regulatory domain-containing protein n=1 Tax=Penicillium argentinense TaxID=1131581 RepID=A0A9W9K2X7_9EURO|nr:uncharacterized protein N7532_009390 [Penicillium argentinense]KAJ5090706.1 hypothetical protein N7532_009390 [Penicillium argentinense]